MTERLATDFQQLFYGKNKLYLNEMIMMSAL